MPSPFRLVYDRSRCISCRACVQVSPNLWFVDEDGVASVKGSTTQVDGSQTIDLNDSELKDHERAVSACPVEIIWIEDVKTGKKRQVNSQSLFIPGR